MMSKNEYSDKNFITHYQQRVWKIKTPGDKFTSQHRESRRILLRINDAQIESEKILHFLSDAHGRSEEKKKRNQ